LGTELIGEPVDRRQFVFLATADSLATPDARHVAVSCVSCHRRGVVGHLDLDSGPKDPAASAGNTRPAARHHGKHRRPDQPPPQRDARHAALPPPREAQHAWQTRRYRRRTCVPNTAHAATPGLAHDRNPLSDPRCWQFTNSSPSFTLRRPRRQQKMKAQATNPVSSGSSGSSAEKRCVRLTPREVVVRPDIVVLAATRA
jgi:hypothetical protein